MPQATRVDFRTTIKTRASPSAAPPPVRARDADAQPANGSGTLGTGIPAGGGRWRTRNPDLRSRSISPATPASSSASGLSISCSPLPRSEFIRPGRRCGRNDILLRNTSVAGRSFDYHARGLQILFGRAIILAAIVAWSILAPIFPYNFLLIALFVFAIPWLAQSRPAFQCRDDELVQCPFLLRGELLACLPRLHPLPAAVVPHSFPGVSVCPPGAQPIRDRRPQLWRQNSSASMGQSGRSTERCSWQPSG